MAVLSEPFGVPGIKSRSTACKKNDLSSVLTLQSHTLLFSFCSLNWVLFYFLPTALWLKPSNMLCGALWCHSAVML